MAAFSRMPPCRACSVSHGPMGWPLARRAARSRRALPSRGRPRPPYPETARSAHSVVTCPGMWAAHPRHRCRASSKGRAPGAERPGVSPMHILDHQHEAELPGNFHQQVNQPGKQPITLPLAHRACGARVRRQQPRHQPTGLHPDILRRPGQCAFEQDASVLPAERVQRLGNRQQRQPFRQRQARPPHRQAPLGGGVPQRLRDKPRLPDSGVADDQQESGTPVQRRPQTGQLSRTAHENTRPGHAASLACTHPAPQQARTQPPGQPAERSQRLEPSLRPGLVGSSQVAGSAAITFMTSRLMSVASIGSDAL